MSLQSVIQPLIGAGFPGQWYDLTDTDAQSLSVEGSDMAFGIAAVQGSSDFQVRVPDHADTLGAGATTDADNKFVGIAIYHATTPRDGQRLELPLGDQDAAYLAPTETGSYAKHGRLRVIAETDVKKNDPVYFRHTLTDPAASPQTEQLGALLNTDAGGNATQIVGASWFASALAGELSVVELTGAVQA